MSNSTSQNQPTQEPTPNNNSKNNFVPKNPFSNNNGGKKFNLNWLYLLIFIGLISFNLFGSFSPDSKEITELEFRTNMLMKNDVQLIQTIATKNVVKVVIIKDSFQKQIYRELFGKQWAILAKSNTAQFEFNVSRVEDYEKELRDFFRTHPNVREVTISPTKDSDWISPFFGTYVLPVLIFFAIWMLISRKMSGGSGGGGMGGGIFNVGKSKAKLFDKNDKVHTTFNDVAGLDEAKAEVVEIVDYLKSPQKYTTLGAKIPKGALLIGPPGTGKTLLAKAVAGEAQVPFFSISGSDFVEMFVGVGASRVRDLFKQAKEKAPCIIFMDEIDAIGRARGKNMMASNDERENTLNQLLVEMDGFGTDATIIILAATNRPDVLDSALLRPGRFDRQIHIDRPDLKGREQIFQVHTKNIKSADSINVVRLSELTPGFAGADIANVCNEAALTAARKNKQAVEMEDFQEAIDRVIGGLEKKNKIISPNEKKIIAYHEAGHAICGWFLEHAHPLLKVTIVPRGTAALGYAQYTPKEQYLYDTDQLNDQICMTLGGRAAEEIFFKKISTGASNDLQQITRMATAMITVYGMSEKIGNISYYDPQQENYFTKPFSEETGKLIDEEVRNIIDKAYIRTLKLLRQKKKEVEILANELLKKEVLFKSDLEVLIGKRPFEEKTPEDTTPLKPEVTPTTNSI